MYRKAARCLDKGNFTSLLCRRETKITTTWQIIDMLMVMYIEITSSLSCQLLNLDRGKIQQLTLFPETKKQRSKAKSHESNHLLEHNALIRGRHKFHKDSLLFFKKM
jgi:hypothetical protein